jgi:hypothetical protein
MPSNKAEVETRLPPSVTIRHTVNEAIGVHSPANT